MKAKKIFLSLLAIFSIMISCEDEEFLDRKPNQLSDEYYYSTPEGLEQGINAAYDILQLGESLGRIEFVGIVCSGDALAGGEPGGNDQQPLQFTMKFQINPTNAYCRTYWNTLYIGIYRCNLLIYYLNKSDGIVSEEDKNRLLGEAYFLRALFHFKLQNLFGGVPQLQASFTEKLKGIPYNDHVLTPEEWEPVRPELEYTWGKIEEDFKTASDLLQPRSAVYTNPNFVGKATKGAALAMLAKTYLYQEKWQL
ncbi:MAG: RagB/SusD family nutrient uptake outer membrane protein, partial [Bacteroidales bacterium]|nr:RagB/SusD family nutrient uptake outer membrane protein [Bacteroidales bacterium]